MLTHWHRAGQDWWRAEWRGLKVGYGYGRAGEVATENLVREVRRLTYRLRSLPPERANDLRAQLRAAGVDP